MLIKGLQKVSLLDYPGSAFPLRGRGTVCGANGG